MFKTLITPALLSLTAVTQLLDPMAAQYDDLLIVEKRRDTAARARLLRHLRKTIVTVNFVDATAKEVVKYLQVATGGKVNFVLIGKSEDMPMLNLQLKSVRMPALMSLIQRQTDLRFTFSSGLVLLKPKELVKEVTYLRMYDVRTAVMIVRSFKPPRLGIRLGELEEAEEEDEGQPMLFSIDRLVELVREHAGMDNWDAKGVSLGTARGVLLVRQSVRGHRGVRKVLVQLGVIPAVRRIVRVKTLRPNKKGKRRAGKKPVMRSGGKPAGKPTGEPAGKPTGKPAGKSAGKPAEKPAGKPTEKPAGKTTKRGS